jgi:hypothetical protein
MADWPFKRVTTCDPTYQNPFVYKDYFIVGKTMSPSETFGKKDSIFSFKVTGYPEIISAKLHSPTPKPSNTINNITGGAKTVANHVLSDILKSDQLLKEISLENKISMAKRGTKALVHKQYKILYNGHKVLMENHWKGYNENRSKIRGLGQGKSEPIA